jgi:hypothetical protein
MQGCVCKLDHYNNSKCGMILVKETVKTPVTSIYLLLACLHQNKDLMQVKQVLAYRNKLREINTNVE